MHWGKAAKRMTRQDVLRLLGFRECCYFMSFKGCFEEVPHQRIEVVHVLVDIASDALLKTCSLTKALKAFLIVAFKHLAFCPKP